MPDSPFMLFDALKKPANTSGDRPQAQGTQMSDSLPEILTSDAFTLRPRPAVCPLQPMDDYVVCERLDSEDSVLVPDHLKKKSNKGRVVAVGPGRLLQNGQYAPVLLEVGDVVVFGGYLKEDAGVTVNDVKWLICQAGDIIAKVKQ